VLPLVAILCGGRGARLQEHTQSIPKPLVEIGGQPILWHVMQIYLAQGFRRFVLLTGYKANAIKAFTDRIEWPAGSEVRCIETGLETSTGGRLARAADVIGSERFCATYADGVADIDLRALLADHDRHRPSATMTVVRPELQESARIDGAGPWRTFTSVTWPAIAPTAWAVLILELVIGYRVFDLIVVITSGGPGFATTLSPYLIYQTGLRGSFDMGTAAAQTLVFAAVVGVVATVFTAARSRSVEAERA
jgi:hypothetical protein